MPTADVLQDSLKQFSDFAGSQVQDLQQHAQDALASVAQPAMDDFKSFTDKLMNAGDSLDSPLNAKPGDPATVATARAASNGADPANLAWARAHMGAAEYHNYCEKFVENANGTTGQFPSALAAAQSAPLATDWSQAKPGDTVYYGGADENGGYGHAAIYSGKGMVVSSAADHETPLQGYFNAPLLGYRPSPDNQHLAPSPVPVESVPAAPPEQSSDPVANFKDFAGNLMSQFGQHVQDAMSGVTGIDNTQPVGPDNQGIAANPVIQAAIAASAKPPSEQTLGDVASIAQAGAQPLEAAANALNPKSIGTAAANAVTEATGGTPKEMPSVPVLSGAADLASSLTTPGGVLPKAGELEAGAQAAPSLADALRAAADHLESKGIGVVGPAMGETLPGDVVAGAGINPAPVVNAVADKASGAAYELNRLLAPAKNTPPEVQAALRDFADVAAPNMGADVQAESLARKVQAVLGKDDNVAAAIHFEQTGEFVPNPTPEQAAVAKEVRDFTQTTGDAGREAGYISGDVTAAPGGPSQYLLHQYEETAQQAAKGGAGLNPKDVYSFERTHATLPDAMAAGLTPVDSVSQPIAGYAGKVLDSQAKVDLVNNLKALPNPPVMDMPPAGAALPDGFVAGAKVAPQFQGVAFTNPVADALTNILAPSAIRNAPILGGAMTGLGVAKENLFSLSGFHLGTELRQAYRAGGPIAGTGVAAKAVWNAAAPAAFDAFRLKNADVFDKWANAGITGLARGERGADIGGSLGGKAVQGAISGVEGAALGAGAEKKAGGNDQDVLKAALIGGAGGALLGPTLGNQFSKALWERAVPTLKVATAELLEKKGYDPQAISTFINQTYGGQNLAAIARSKTVQDVLRIGVLSPDWWEGWARQVASGVKPGDIGKMSRAYWLRTAAIDGAFGLEGMNKAINGHFTNENEPGRQFELEITGLVGKDAEGNRQYLDTLGPLRSIVQVAASTAGGATKLATGKDVPMLDTSGNPGQFVNSRMGLPLSLGLSAITNKDYANNPIVAPGTPAPQAALGTADAALQRLAPIGGQQLSQLLSRTTTSPDLSQKPAPGATLGETLGTVATGMRTSAGPDTSLLYGQRDEGIAALQGKNERLYNAYQQASLPLDKPPTNFDKIALNPAEQLAWQQARLQTLQSMFKPGELDKVLAMKALDRDAVLGKLLQAADKVAAGQVIGKMGNDAVNARLQQRVNYGRQNARAEAIRQPYLPQFTAPAAT